MLGNISLQLAAANAMLAKKNNFAMNISRRYCIEGNKI